MDILRTILRRRWKRTHVLCGGTVTPTYPTLEEALEDELSCNVCGSDNVSYQRTALMKSA